MARPYKLVALQVSSTSGGIATIAHGAHGSAAVNIDAAGIDVDRRTYPSNRPHPGGNPVLMTVAGVITIPDGTAIAIESRLKNPPPPPPPPPPGPPPHPDLAPITVLLAEVTGGKLKVVSREPSIPISRNGRRANMSKLRRIASPNEEVFYVWTRDQYRFTIRKV